MSNFINLVRKTCVYNRKAIMLTIGAVILGCIIFGTAMGLLGRGGGTAEVVCFGLMFLLIATVVASMIFGDFKTKAGKITTLMTPATHFEKFAVRWLAAVPLLALLFVAGFYVGDISRIVANRFSDYYVAAPAYHRIVNVFNVITQFTPDEKSLTIVTLLIYYFFWQSLYLLGGIAWPKLSFIKTFALIRVVNLVLLPIINEFDARGIGVAIVLDLSEMVLWMDIAMVIFTVGIYWLTYYLMKRSTVA